MTDDPFSSLLAAAVTLHEMFVNFMEAGFTEHQALYLISQMMVAQIQSATNEEES